MVDEYVVDTHALIWYLEGSPRLGINARTAMRDPASHLVLPVIALAEACWTVERGRCTIPSVASLFRDVDVDPRITLVPLDRSILDLSLTLTSVNEMHDRQILATALQRARRGTSVALLTCDRNLTSSGLVPVVW
jgi:PIN domain nuclease of toxin-antitoxin system